MSGDVSTQQQRLAETVPQLQALEGKHVVLVTANYGVRVGKLARLNFNPGAERPTPDPIYRITIVGDWGESVQRAFRASMVLKVGELVLEAGSGDTSSHGATWEHMLRAVKDLLAEHHWPSDVLGFDTRQVEDHYNHCVGMAAEAWNANHGISWEICYDQLVTARDNFLIRNGLQAELLVRLLPLVETQAQLEYEDMCRFAEQLGMSKPERNF